MNNKKNKYKKIQSSQSQSVIDSFLNSVFNNNQAIMLLVDFENNQKILDANESALNFYGYTRKEILMLDMGSINTNSEEERQRLIEKAIKLPHSSYQFIHKTSSGILKTVEVNASTVDYKNKKVMFIIVHDITDLKIIEVALKESEERFRGLADATTEAVFLSENGICIDQNKRAEELFGYTHNEAVGVPAVNWIISKDRDIVSENIKSEYSEKYEITGLHKDGSTFPAEIRGKMLDYKGRRVRVTTLKDLTDSKKALSELIKSNERFELAMVGSNLGLWDWWVQTGDLHINKRWAEMLGYNLQELSPISNANWRELCHPDDLAVVDTHFQRYLKKETDFYRADLRMKHKNGSWIWIETHGKVFEWTEDGKPLRVAGTHLDINEKKIMEMKLAASEERLGLALAGSELGLWDWWIQTGEAHFNERWAELIGYTLEEISPVSIKTWEENTHPEDLPGARLLLQKYFNEEIDIYEYQFRMKHKDGSWVWIMDRGKVFEWDGDGKPIRMSGTHLDITERKQAEFKISESEKRYRGYFESSPLSLWEQDFTEVIIYLDKLIESNDMDIKSLLDSQPQIVKKCVDLVKIIDVNPATIKLYNAHSKEDLLWSLSRVFTEESYRTFKDEIIFIYNREFIPTRESTNKLLDGRIINVLIESAFLLDNRYIKTITDITELKTIGQQLTESENKFRGYFESSPMSLWEEDYTDIISYIEGFPVSNEKEFSSYLDNHPKVLKKCSGLLKILDVNKKTLELYEAESKEELINNFDKLFTKVSVSLFKKKLVSLYNRKIYFSDETIHKTLSGKEIIIKLSSVLLSNDRSLITISDITDQKIIEKQLLESEAKFRSYFESSPLSLWEQDYSQLILYLNELRPSIGNGIEEYIDKNPDIVKKCSKMINTLNVNHATELLYESQEKENLLLNFEKIDSPISYKIFEKKIISIYKNEDIFSAETEHTTFKGNKINIRLESIVLVKYKVLTIITDITELKSKEDELKVLLNQTKADFETKEILLREINHRVKNNLSSFIGLLYAEKKQSGTDFDTVQMEHIDSLINRVKGISIAHEMLSRSQWAPISINKLIEKIIHSLNYLIPKDRIINVKLNPSNIFLDADQSHSTSILLNELYLNSIEHASHPGEELEVEIEIREKKGMIIFIYSDSGTGYSEEILKLEFKNVGMYLIKNIIEQSLRGKFKISNEGGAKIEIEFPGGSKLEEI